MTIHLKAIRTDTRTWQLIDRTGGIPYATIEADCNKSHQDKPLGLLLPGITVTTKEAVLDQARAFIQSS